MAPNAAPFESQAGSFWFNAGFSGQTPGNPHLLAPERTTPRQFFMRNSAGGYVISGAGFAGYGTVSANLKVTPDRLLTMRLRLVRSLIADADVFVLGSTYPAMGFVNEILTPTLTASGFEEYCLSIGSRRAHLSGFIREVAKHWSAAALDVIRDAPHVVEPAAQAGVSEESLRREFDADSWSLVVGFVRKHPEVDGALLAMPRMVESLFGDRRVVLSVYADDETGSEQLVAEVRTDLEPHEALPLLAELDRRWWIEAAPGVNGRLVVNLGYI
jgi:hypothetical protein